MLSLYQQQQRRPSLLPINGFFARLYRDPVPCKRQGEATPSQRLSMHRLSTRHNTLTVLVIGSLLACYAGVLVRIVHVWSTHYLYSYGFVVPLISGYMLWARSDALDRAVRARDYRAGFLVTGIGVMLLVTGHIGAIESVEYLSVIVTVCGATLLLFGRSVFRVAWFPVLYLALGIPVWHGLIGDLQGPSQHVSAAIATTLLRLAGIPAIQDQTLVVLPNVTLEVLRECSGVNQLVSVGAMSLAAAFLWLTRPSRRIALLAISVIVAYFTNGIRIALVGFLSYHHLSNGNIRILHLTEGLAVSVIGYAIILACLSLLARTEGRVRDEPLDQDKRQFLPNIARWPVRDLSLAALFAAVALYIAMPHAPGVSLNKDLQALPSQINDWTALATAKTSGFRLTGADDELIRAYRHPSGATVRLYVGYQAYQIEGKELVEPIAFSEPLQASGDTRAGTLFWYDVNGRVLTNLYVAKGYTIWDAMTRGRTNGAVVAIEWQSPGEDDFARSKEDVMKFANALMPLLRGYLPSSQADNADTSPEVGVHVTP